MLARSHSRGPVRLLAASVLGALAVTSCGGLSRPDFSTGSGGADAEMGGAPPAGGGGTDSAHDGEGGEVGGTESTGGTNGRSGVAGGTTGLGGEGAVGGTGGVTMNGTGGAQTDVPASPWRGGPCIATPDGLTWEAFERGSDQRIYRRTESNSWSALADLEGSAIDKRSDLDCSATGTTMFIAALGTKPLGSYLIATGFGTSYNQFQQWIDIGSFNGSAGVAALTSSSFVASAVSQGRATVVLVSSSGETYYSLPSVSPDLDGPTDITRFSAFTAQHTYLVAFDDANRLVIQKHTATSNSSGWDDAQLIPSPGGEYLYSPTVCHTRTNIGFPARHLVAATDVGIWFSVAAGSTDDFSGWELMSDVVPMSAPDCVALGDGTVHAVVLTAAGVADLHGRSGDFRLTDLGIY